MTVAVLLQWWNLVYLLPACFGFLMLLLQLVGLQGKELDLELEHEAEVLELAAEGDIETDVDFDAEADLAVDSDLEVEAEADGALDGDLEAEGELSGEGKDQALVATSSAEASLFLKVAIGLGVGKVPLSIVLMNLCFTWGFFGVWMNSLLIPKLPNPVFFFPVSIVLTLAASGITTGWLSRLLGKYMPSKTTHFTVAKHLEGKIGRTLYSVKPVGGGTVRIEGTHGNLLQFDAFLSPEAETIPGDTPVLFVFWDAKKEAFEIERAPTELLE